MKVKGESRLSGVNMFEKELERKFGPGYLEKLSEVKVGIAGAGGLGSNCAVNLSRCGFVRFVISDFDVVEYSNLDRQFYFLDQVGGDKVAALKINLMRINPDIKIETFCVKVDAGNAKEIFSDCPVVVEAFDRAEEKKMLVETLMGDGKFIVSASGFSGIGNTDAIVTRRIRKDLVMVGDLTSDVSESPSISPRVNVAAAKQADAVLEYVLGADWIRNKHVRAVISGSDAE